MDKGCYIPDISARFKTYNNANSFQTGDGYICHKDMQNIGAMLL